MTDAERKALSEKAHLIDVVRMCWAPTAAGGWCGGIVVWSNQSGEWRSACRRCGASGLAAAGERSDLERDAS